MQPAYAPQGAILKGNEDLADLAAELAAMLTLAESSTPVPAQSLDESTQSIELMHCQDGTEAFSLTADPAPIVIEPTEAPTTITATVLSTDWSVPAALPEQEQGVASPKGRDKSPCHCERLLAAAATTSREAGIAVCVDTPLDASTWHAPLVEVSSHHATQLQNMLTAAGTAFLIKCPKSLVYELLTYSCCILADQVLCAALVRALCLRHLRIANIAALSTQLDSAVFALNSHADMLL